MYYELEAFGHSRTRPRPPKSTLVQFSIALTEEVKNHL